MPTIWGVSDDVAEQMERANQAYGDAFPALGTTIIDSEEERDRVSSYGWAMGYLGGGLLLVEHLRDLVERLLEPLLRRVELRAVLAVEVGPGGAIYLLLEHTAGSQILRMLPAN